MLANTEWKYLLNSSAFSESEVAGVESRNIVGGKVEFLESDLIYLKILLEFLWANEEIR